MNDICEIIDEIYKTGNSTADKLVCVINNITEKERQYLFKLAADVSKQTFGNKIYIRGLIEFTNYCKNDCYYCGIRKSNDKCSRYRLTKQQILSACETGYNLGFRTFVLQGGEDGFFTDDKMVDIISEIRNKYLDCAITLSIGEKSKQTYKKYYDAGANRYLLRHETSNKQHYEKLHPTNLNQSTRLQCLDDLKEIGFEVGTGFMVGSPYQTTEDLAQDLLFVKAFSPHMIGIGPFVSHKDTPFYNMKNGTLTQTLIMISLLRLMNPLALIPSTTALGTISKSGRTQGVLAGANVVMPNLSPETVREKYLLYDNKICTDEEASEGLDKLKRQMFDIGYEVVSEIGSSPKKC